MANKRPDGDGLVRKRSDGRWEGRIVVGHKSDGKPIYRSVFARTQKELMDKLHAQIEVHRDVELTEGYDLTLAQWLDRWLDEYKAYTVRASTLQGYKRLVKNYIIPHLGDKKLGSVTTADLQKLYNWLRENGRIHEHYQKVMHCLTVWCRDPYAAPSGNGGGSTAKTGGEEPYQRYSHSEK